MVGIITVETLCHDFLKDIKKEIRNSPLSFGAITFRRVWEQHSDRIYSTHGEEMLAEFNLKIPMMMAQVNQLHMEAVRAYAPAPEHETKIDEVNRIR